MKKIAKVLIKIVIAVILIAILFFISTTLLMWWQLTPVTNVFKYEKVKSSRWHRPDLIHHFPKAIPSNAQNPQFYFRAGFLQGGATIELRLQMPENFVEDVYTTYRPKAKIVFNGAEELDRGAENPNMLPKWHFYTSPQIKGETTEVIPLLPSDFEILLLSSHPYRKAPVSWNHGDCSGISISRKRNEIIYWAEDW